MKLSLPLRIFLIHLGYTLVFAVVAGVLVIGMVQNAYDRYAAEWKEKVEDFPPEQMYLPIANEFGRSLLLELLEEHPVEYYENYRNQVSAGLSAVLQSVPAVRGLFILDRERRIQYASNEDMIDQAFTDDQIVSALATNQPTYREVGRTESGEAITRVLVPIYHDPAPGEDSGERERLGWVFLVHGPDPNLAARLPDVQPPTVEARDITLPAVGFVTALAMGSLIVAALGVVPVRRLEKALADFKARGFRGGFQAERLARTGELAASVQAINELGGQLEALADHGREREALLATLSQSLEDGMIAVDPEGVPLAWNPASLRILGLDADEGSSAGIAAPDRTDGTEDESAEADPVRKESALRDALRRNPALLTPGEGAGVPGQREVQIENASGSTSLAKVTRVPLEVRPGETGTLLLIRDMATLRKVETHLLEAGRYAVLAHLAAGLAHEIRNPLHSIGLNAGVVEQYVGGEWSESKVAAVSDSLKSIQSETRRLTDLLNNYLGLVRPATRQEPVDLRALCDRVIQLMSYTAKQAGVRLEVGGEASVPTVQGVADRLQQAILNLVLNAIQAMPEGGTIRISTSHNGNAVRLTVRDTGPGIPDEMRDGLFEIGVSDKPTGTGLGLPLVRLIAETHGGKVTYRKAPGKGSVFTLELPAVVAERV